MQSSHQHKVAAHPTDGFFLQMLVALALGMSIVAFGNPPDFERPYRSGVYGHLAAIAGAPRAAMAILDATEGAAPLQKRWYQMAMIGVLLFGAGACLGLVWRQQRARLDRIKHEGAAARLRLSAIVESSDDAILSKSLDGVITSWNAGAERLYGYSAAEAIGNSVTMLIPPGHPNEFPQLMEKIKRGETVKHYETERLRKNGERVAMSLSLSPIKDPAGAIVGASVIGHDITEHKQAEAAQKASEQSYQALFENMLNGFAYCKMLYDEQHQPVDFVYLAVNKAFEQLTGLTNVVGKPVSEVIPGIREQSPALFAAYDRVARSGQPERFELDFKPLNQWLSIAVYSPARGYFVATFDNITERKRAEAQQAKLEAQNRQLQKSESLGRMAGAIAHHYNNKLQTIMGNLELAIANLPPGTKTLDYLKDAMQAARRAAEVSVQMLAYLGKSSGVRKPLYLSEVCRQYLPLLQSTMPVVLETAFAEPGPVIIANANQIQQVLVNLVTNAWEALGTSRDAIRVSITTVAAEEIRSTDRFPIGWQPHAGSHACLEVADAGCGIAAEEIEKIFDPFFSRKFVGRGLGLSVVLGIVKAHDGCITVESAPGRGSTFRVYFPVTAQTALPGPPGALPVPDFQAGGTVLVVEDDASVLALAAHVIRSLGFTVLTAEDGVAALEVFRQHQAEVRCVLSDLSMPRMNGWQTIAALRQLAPGIPVILASGYDEASVMANHHAEQPQAFLGKPYNREELRAALGRALAGRQPGLGSS